MAIKDRSVSNAILSRSSPRFGASAERVTFREGDQILRSNQATSHVFFPESLVGIFVRRLLDGSTTEVGMVGFEGAIGIETMFGSISQPSEVIAQVGGTAMRVPAAAASQAFETDAKFRRLVLRFAHARTLQIGQTAVCNRFHSIDRRLARFLLRIADNVAVADKTIEISLTQEVLANMLGSRIASINEAVSAFTASGLIRHRRHLIEIVDRPGLEAAACECYATVRALYERDEVM
jgi:CRP-like cAMP-binding protein